MNARRSRTTTCAVLPVLLGGVLTAGCGPSSPPPQCADGQQRYEDTCLSQATVEFMKCTAGRGVDVTTEVNVGVGASFKTVTDASLSVAYKKAQKENSTVALQVVQGCGELAEKSGVRGQEQAQLAEFQKQVDKSIDDFSRFNQSAVNATAAITISKSGVRVGDRVTVQGSGFLANETVDVQVDLRSVARATANSKGSFSTTVTIPEIVQPKAPSHYIVASGKTSSRTDKQPITVLP